MKNTITRLAPDRTKSSPTIRESINWWNKLSVPERSQNTKLCYPQQQSVHITDKQKDQMYNLLNK